MKDDSALKSRSAAPTADLAELVNKSSRTSSPLFILTEAAPKSNRRGEVLAAAYKYILSDAWGQR